MVRWGGCTVLRAQRRSLRSTCAAAGACLPLRPKARAWARKSGPHGKARAQGAQPQAAVLCLAAPGGRSGRGG